MSTEKLSQNMVELFKKISWWRQKRDAGIKTFYIHSQTRNFKKNLTGNPAN
jgi:hypothetical protein